MTPDALDPETTAAWRAVLLATVLLLGPACAGPQPGPQRPPGPVAHTVYVINLGWHTGIALPRAALPAEVWPEVRDFPEVDYLEVGWGDRAFYQTPDPGLGLALKAALTPTPGVLHLVGIDGPVPAYFPGSGIIGIGLSAAAFEQVYRFIAATHDRPAGGTAQALGKGLYPDSRFYPAKGTFHLFNNCNTWMARVLLAAGCPADPARVVTAADLMRQAGRCGRVVKP